jgi:hypothetical protein
MVILKKKIIVHPDPMLHQIMLLFFRDARNRKSWFYKDTSCGLRRQHVTHGLRIEFIMTSTAGSH